MDAVDQLITCHLHMTNGTAPSPNELDYGLYLPGSGHCVFIVCHQGRELSIVQAWPRIYEICLIRQPKQRWYHVSWPSFCLVLDELPQFFDVHMENIYSLGLITVLLVPQGLHRIWG